MATSPSAEASSPMSAEPETRAADAVVPADVLMNVGLMPFLVNSPSTSATAIGMLTNDPARVTILTLTGAFGSAVAVPELDPEQPAASRPVTVRASAAAAMRRVAGPRDRWESAMFVSLIMVTWARCTVGRTQTVRRGQRVVGCL